MIAPWVAVTVGFLLLAPARQPGESWLLMGRYPSLGACEIAREIHYRPNRPLMCVGAWRVR